MTRPGNSSTDRNRPRPFGLPSPGRTLGLLLAAVMTVRFTGEGQVRVQNDPPDSSPSVRSVLASARAAQDRFERLRRQWSPRRMHGWLGTNCDEIVGRICLRYDEGGDWWPEPEDPRIVEGREALLAALDSAAVEVPSDAWTVGQQVFYRAEAGRWEDAEAIARACAALERGWCNALLGLALHGQGRFSSADVAFREGIAEMDEADRRRWSEPKWLVDGEASDALEDAGPPGSIEYERALDLAWRMADPLYLVEGNDRLTEHWARLTVARVRGDATNPYAMRWGRDLEEILVRFGWEVGWDRVVDGVGNLGSVVVGHHHPESRSYFPSGTAVRDPLGPGALTRSASARRQQEAYAPAYAPVILSGDAEFFRFPRGDHLLLVGVLALPADTGRHAGHGHPSFDAPPAFKDRPTQAGLFLVPLGGGPTVEARAFEARGTLSVEVGPGAYLASLEVWSPERGFAGRIRESLVSRSLPPDLLTLSDLVVLSGPQPDSARLEDVTAAVLRSKEAISGRSLAVGWEVFGLGWRPEVLDYRLSVERQDPSLLRRLGGWLGLGRTEPEVTLEWEEGSPPTPGPSFRSVTIDLPGLDAGFYRLTLELRSQGRDALIRDRVVVLSGP